MQGITACLLDFITGDLTTGVISGIVATAAWSSLVMLYKTCLRPRLANRKIICKTLYKVESDIYERVDCFRSEITTVAQAYFNLKQWETFSESDKYKKLSEWHKSEAERLLNGIDFDFRIIYSIEEINKLFEECKHIMPDIYVRKIEQVTLTNKYISDAFEAYKESLKNDCPSKVVTDILYALNTHLKDLYRILFIIHQIKEGKIWHHTGSVKIASETIRVKYRLPDSNCPDSIARHWRSDPLQS